MSDGTDLVAIMEPSERVRSLRRILDAVTDRLHPVVNLSRPYVDGLENLPPDGRFLLVGNHTQFGSEVFMIPDAVRRSIGTRVRPLADRNFGRLRGLPADLMAAFGGVIGAPENARELMRHDETILVFPGGGGEIAKFKGEEYTLRWQALRLRSPVGRAWLPDRAGRAGGGRRHLSQLDYTRQRIREIQCGTESSTRRPTGHGDAIAPGDRTNTHPAPPADVSAVRRANRHHDTAGCRKRSVGEYRQRADSPPAGRHTGRPAPAARS